MLLLLALVKKMSLFFFSFSKTKPNLLGMEIKRMKMINKTVQSNHSYMHGNFCPLFTAVVRKSRATLLVGVRGKKSPKKLSIQIRQTEKLYKNNVCRVTGWLDTHLGVSGQNVM